MHVISTPAGLVGGDTNDACTDMVHLLNRGHNLLCYVAAADGDACRLDLVDWCSHGAAQT
jgi:hypothetical protein